MDKYSLKYLPLLIMLMAGLGILSIWIGIQAQQVSLKMILVFSLMLMIYLISITIFKISIHNLFLIYSTLLLYPIAPVLIFVSVTLFVLGSLEILNRDKMKLLIPYSFLLLILFIAGTQAYIRSSANEASLQFYYTTILIPILAIIIIYNSKLTKVKIKKIIRFNVYIAGTIGFLGIIIALLNPNDRIGSTWQTAMTINGYYIMNFFCGLAFFLSDKNKTKKMIMLTLSALIFLGMIFTYTRIALLAVFFGLGLIALKEKKFRKYLIMILILVPLIIPASMSERVTQGVQGDTSTFIRFLAWYNSFKLIMSHPFQGIGFRTFARVSKSMIPVDFLYAEHSHNLYIHIMLEIGLFGFIAYFALIFSGIISFYKNIVRQSKDNFYFIFAVSLLAIMFAGMTDIFIARLNISLFFWVYLAFALKFIKISKENNLQNTRISSESNAVL